MTRKLTRIIWIALAAIGCLQITGSAWSGQAYAAGTIDSENPSEISDPRRRSRRLAIERVTLTDKESQLIKRPDRQRPATPLSIPLFGRPLTFGGRYTGLLRSDTHKLLDFDFIDTDKDDFDGDGDVDELEDTARGNVPNDDQLRFNQTLQLDLFYPMTEKASVYLESRVQYRNRVWANHADTRTEWIFERGESWLYLGDLFDTPIALQVGHQRFADEREWWWDQNLDAIRVRFDKEVFHAEVAVAEQLLGLEYGESIEPDDKDVLRILGTASWEWARKQQVAIYALHTHDHSSLQDVMVKDPDLLCVPEELIPPQIPPEFREIFRAGCIDPVRFEDDSDPDLTWFGVSASGRWKLGTAGVLEYWFDVAGVTGKETFTDYSGSNDNRRVRSVGRHTVDGFGIDLRSTWKTRLPGRPYMTLGYAYGSGKSNMLEEVDRGFRQTGLEDNSQKFGGAQSFRFYGELLNPELSNLQILTAGLGIRFFQKSSFDVVYHHYRQAEVAPFLRDVGFRRDPDGKHRSIGQEIDMILGLRDLGWLEVKLVGSIFRPGKAFARDEGDLSYLGVLRLRLNF